MSHSNAETYIDEMSVLKGGRILFFVIDKEDPDGDEFFGMVVRTVAGERKILWINEDDEANGPGSIKIDNFVTYETRMEPT